MYSVILKIRLSNTLRARHASAGAAGASALHKRIHPSKFDSAEHVAGCGSLVLKSIKRSVIKIGRSMFDVRCSTFNLFPVLSEL
jgi:hypothetical protein